MNDATPFVGHASDPFGRWVRRAYDPDESRAIGRIRRMVRDGVKVHRDDHCDGAGHVRVLVRQSNGVWILRARCIGCGAITRTRGRKPGDERYPVWADYVDPELQCARCKSNDGVELHHWAPRALFVDADNWPTDYLCRTCHATWHSVMDRRQAAA